jgi:hypothetical protein
MGTYGNGAAANTSWTNVGTAGPCASTTTRSLLCLEQ